MMISGARTDAAASGTLSSAVLIILILSIGATIYLQRAGYIRPKAGLVTALILCLALIGLGFWMYRTG